MALESGLLWQLQFETQTSYLFGTIHLNSPLFSDNYQTFSSLLDQSSVFAAEVNLDLMDQFEMNDYFKMSENTNWSEHLKGNQWNKLQSVCTKYFNLNLEHYSNIYPLVLVNQLSMQLIGMHVEKSLDQQLWECAASKNMTRVGLEDFESHFNLIRAIDLYDQIKMLKDLLKNLEGSRKKYLKMLQDYHAQDLRSIYQASRKMLGKYRRLMLFERNEIMLDKIMQLGKDGNCFLSCGAGHLYGEQGLLRLLKKQGVSVKHVRL
jgi:uncharacterized protein YbaP (TraB family)